VGGDAWWSGKLQKKIGFGELKVIAFGYYSNPAISGITINPLLAIAVETQQSKFNIAQSNIPLLIIECQFSKW
jgi:hypothetical protein